MKQNMRKRTPLAMLLALCLAMQLCVPAAMASNRLMRAGDAAIEQIEEEEGFRAEKYSSGGKWYIGYGTECGAEDYPEGITREEAELLLMSKVEAYEAKLNDFFDRYDVTPTQGQFDALICFSYNFGTGWMSGTSDLVKIARGEKDATRLEVAHAFGEWCHSGGQAQAGLADRRLQEAAIYLDDDTRAAEDEFCVSHHQYGERYVLRDGLRRLRDRQDLRLIPEGGKARLQLCRLSDERRQDHHGKQHRERQRGRHGAVDGDELHRQDLYRCQQVRLVL